MTAASSSPRLRVLSVLSSSNQMYSGIGRNVFELIRRMNDRCAYELAIDDGHERNTSLVVDFARSHGIPVHVGRGERQPGCLDLGNADLPRLLQSRRWDVVEAVCFANAATNQAVLDSLGDTPLVYTPHDQPLWTVPMAADEAAQTAAVHQRMTARADLILCDSRSERKTVQQLAPSRSSAVHLPLGCDFDQFAPGGWPRAEQLLFVGDLVEPRKRFDRALAAFAHVKPRWPGLKLVVVGNRSQDATGMIPPTLRPSIELRGYIDEPGLRAAYAASRGFLLLSDFEAFGIPILEALASGTPAFITDQAETRGLFSPYAGAHICPADDPVACGHIIDACLSRGPEAIEAAARDHHKLRAVFDWPHLARCKTTLLQSVWFRRRGFALAA